MERRSRLHPTSGKTSSSYSKPSRVGRAGKKVKQFCDAAGDSWVTERKQISRNFLRPIFACSKYHGAKLRILTAFVPFLDDESQVKGTKGHLTQFLWLWWWWVLWLRRMAWDSRKPIEVKSWRGEGTVGLTWIICLLSLTFSYSS